MKWKIPTVSHPSRLPVLKPWASLTGAERRREIVRYAKRNSGKAVTLNFAATFQLYIAKSKQPMREISKRMNAELRKDDLHHLPVMLVLEATQDDGRLHLHGVYLDCGLSKQQVQQPMRRAVGYVSGRSGSRQFYAKSLHFADGWNSYSSKAMVRTRRLLGLSNENQLCWTSHSLTRRVRDDYEAVRLGKIPAANNPNPIRPAA